MELLMYPITVKMLAAELITACDAYISRQINVGEFKEFIYHCANNYPEMLFNAQELNPTVLNRVGKKRENLINKILVGSQIRL